MKASFYSLTYEHLKIIVSNNGFNPKVASDLFNWHYKKKFFTPCELRISKKSKDYIYENFDFTLPRIHKVYEAEDRTVKFQMRFSTEDLAEAVLIPFQGKYSLCVSSQVGCAMKCAFCYTGTQGFLRHLKTEDIIGQFLVAYEWLKSNRPDDTWISNIVFMGQGEPLHNFDHVKSACEIFLCQHGFSISPQKITVSTSGFLPGLLKWKEKSLGVNLALSLHSTKNNIRNELIPINQKYPLEDVLKTIDEIPLLNKQFVTYEYLLIKDLNDSPEDAEALGQLLAPRRALINLIPFNPFPGSKYQRPDDTNILKFKSVLANYNTPAMIRTTKGDSILAACGQLKA